MEKSKEISVIVPVRIQDSRSDIIERLAFCIRPEAKNIEYIIVDDGSLPDDALMLKKRCKALGMIYVCTHASNASLFNLARARNLGAQSAKGTYVLFLDVDLIPYPGFYDDLKIEIELIALNNNTDLFIMCPVVYLNDAGYAEYQKHPKHLKKYFASELLIQGDVNRVEKYSHGTSCILVNRCYYLSIGGQNEKFSGWGYEDYEFTTRLMNLARLFPKPTKYESMVGNFMNIREYKGWKAEYRLYGARLALKSMYLIHVPHNEDGGFKSNVKNNQTLLNQSLKIEWKNQKIQGIIPQQEYSLVLSRNPFCLHYKLNTILGQWEYVDYTESKSLDDLIYIFENSNFTQIVFPNPYGNTLLRSLYEYCNQKEIKYIVCERGALPGSIFHDSNGFLFDSSSYHPLHWDRQLSEQNNNDVDEYLQTLKQGDSTLEQQPQRITKDDFSVKLDITESSFKVGLILQTENDTVIKFFGRKFKKLNDVKLFIEKIINKHCNNISFIYKNHPLETNPINITGATCADEFHIHDIIDHCDAILTVNSGAGLIAALLGKPVFLLGDCWYAQPGIACQINSEDEFLSNLKRFSPSKEKRYRFTYYLRYQFYSFGYQHTVLHQKKASKINATYQIDYEEVQTKKFGRLMFLKKDYSIGFKSILFQQYSHKSLLLASKNKDFKKSLRNKKIKKLKETPIKFFLDAIRNIY
ncbi:glycosyltransferase [Colwellia sp. 1_MG-2023]|uniref:capsular polysaccharide export protein, LipB/KpsS family n=1 Tax=Colwellia sp. 1_MG-2023 TaxID=3062649 RepID=UPI0026E48A1F|nr:glycosyltransferase [Colwellia sp. 1_MG-2023]